VALGRVETFTGSTLLLAGVGIASGTAHSLSGNLSQTTPWAVLVLASLLSWGGIALFHKGRRVRVLGERLRSETIRSFDELSGQHYVLYLRPFDLDEQTAELPTEPPSRWWASDFNLSRRTYEEDLVRWFEDVGRVVAVGRPEEPLPLVGAQRGYLSHDEWQDVVSRLITGAHVVVLAVGPREGTVWEFNEALRRTDPERLVLLVYHRVEAYDQFRSMVRAEYNKRSRSEPGPWPSLPDLPGYPPVRHSGRRSWDYGLKGVITFDSAWRATFTRFDPTRPLIPITLAVNGIQRRGMKPVQDHLAQLPARVPR
jgi:hypothetical protein